MIYPYTISYTSLTAFKTLTHLQGIDVLLVDTAGRMQDNTSLMREIATVISDNRPDLTLFVGEALVGNDAVDQLTKFNQRLTELSKVSSSRERGCGVKNGAA